MVPYAIELSFYMYLPMISIPVNCRFAEIKVLSKDKFTPNKRKYFIIIILGIIAK